MKTRSYHHGDLRAVLLTLAEGTLRHRGSAELSLRELARAAGVSPAAPSRHFKSKQTLLDALAIEGFDRLTIAMEEALEQAGESFPQRLSAVVRTYLGFATANAALLELMFTRKHEPTASAEVLGSMQRLAGMATGLIEDGQRRGEVRAGPVELLAVPLTAALQGLTALTQSGAFTTEQAGEGLTETIEFLLRGYAP